MEQASNGEMVVLISTAVIFWGVIIGFAAIWWHMHRSAQQRVSPIGDGILLHKTPQACDVLQYKGPYVRQWLKEKPPVQFDPLNEEHQVALALLLLRIKGQHGETLPSRLHPTLRFEFDPAVHDNAYQAMLETFALQNLSHRATTLAYTIATQKSKNKVVTLPARKLTPLKSEGSSTNEAAHRYYGTE